jgi:hypothetical protein
VLYGYQENAGCWDFTLIETKPVYLNQLPFTEEKMTRLPRSHASFNEDIITILNPGHSHFNGMMRGDDNRFTTPLIDTLKPGHANWQKLFNANNLSQNPVSLTTRRNSLEGFFKLSLCVGTKRNANTIYLKGNPEGKGLDYEVIGLDGSLKMGTIPWDKLPPRKLSDNCPQTIRDIKDITSTFLSPILTYVSSQSHIKLPTREQKKGEREDWIKTAHARISTSTSKLFDFFDKLLSPRLARKRSNSLSPSASPRERSNSLSPRRPFFNPSPRRGSKQQISPGISNASPEEKPTTIITASEDVPILKKKPG